ncbi:unnamed protein product [Musa acuminata var. zebrina]
MILLHLQDMFLNQNYLGCTHTRSWRIKHLQHLGDRHIWQVFFYEVMCLHCLLFF